MTRLLFPPEFFHALAGLARRRSRPGGGNAATPRAGRGLLGFEHRAYAPGDDLRQLDWRATARAGAAQLRLREEERGGSLRLVLDRSPSMAPGGARREEDLRRLALALGWLHLEAGGVLRLVAGGGPEQTFVGYERRAALQEVLEGLEPPLGGPGVEGMLRGGPCVWLTDPWCEPPPVFPGDATVVTLVLPEEDDPATGGLRLKDAESAEELEVELDAADWSRRWDGWLERRQRRLRAAGARALVLRCGAGGATALLQRAEEAGLV
ncbi:MAG: DUF58 domain-containing protein [Planctomycetes bacterium]|nr:DUF58 domain-containing protein [Planctomycetota bacterium]